MKTSEKVVVGIVAVVLVAAAVWAFLPRVAPQVAGDFPGGIASHFDSASASGGLTGNGYVAPNGSFAYAALNGISIGPTADQYHGTTVFASASGTPGVVATLGPTGSTTSTASTTITVTETQGLAIGAICSGSSATTTVFVAGCVLSTTNGATGTAQIWYENGTASSLAVPTSTVFRLTFDELPY